jgi:hypothetical protein
MNIKVSLSLINWRTKVRKRSGVGFVALKGRNVEGLKSGHGGDPG